MIPTQVEYLTDYETVTQPSKTYGLNMETNRIAGFVDDLEAMKQAIYLILNTERYQYLIYSWNYGVELVELFGKPTSYASAKLQMRIKEALLQDDRITDIKDFECTVKGSTITTTFTAVTTVGDVDITKEVTV